GFVIAAVLYFVLYLVMKPGVSETEQRAEKVSA
ncbi:MAG: hypothetical protein JWR06_682, partial [Jatrophihabitans sp.]|nr:hypothetical protein [Jatrophihabitans sp.]